MEDYFNLVLFLNGYIVNLGFLIWKGKRRVLVKKVVISVIDLWLMRWKVVLMYLSRNWMLLKMW